MLDSVHMFMKKTGQYLGLPADTIERLKAIDNEHLFKIHLNSGKSFAAYRIQHNNQLGPYKGGIRFHKSVNLDEMRALATLMSLKTAAAGLPLGGAKGGVTLDPQTLDEAELEELSRKYIAHLYPHIGPAKDVLAPDVNTNAKFMGWMMDEYEKLTGDDGQAGFTGKSVEQGGSLGRDAATGRGGVIALEDLLALEKTDDRAITLAIQGFGNVGSYFGVIAEELRPKWHLVAASDSEAAVYSAAGLSAKQLQNFKQERGRFKAYAQTNVAVISNDNLISLDVDVLVLAGLENAVTTANMKQVKARYIVEMGNGPVASEAYDYLTKAGKVILPDIIANAGGVIVSYLEWLQNKQGEHWTEDKVNRHLAKLIKQAVKNMYSSARADKLSLKQAAFAMAIQRLIEEAPGLKS